MQLSGDGNGFRWLRMRRRFRPRLRLFWRFDDSLFNAFGAAPGLCVLRGVDSAVWLRNMAGDPVVAKRQGTYREKNNGAKRVALIRWSEESLSTGRSAWLPRHSRKPSILKLVAHNFFHVATVQPDP